MNKPPNKLYYIDWVDKLDDKYSGSLFADGTDINERRNINYYSLSLWTEPPDVEDLTIRQHIKINCYVSSKMIIKLRDKVNKMIDMQHMSYNGEINKPGLEFALKIIDELVDKIK